MNESIAELTEMFKSALLSQGFNLAKALKVQSSRKNVYYEEKYWSTVKYSYSYTSPESTNEYVALDWYFQEKKEEAFSQTVNSKDFSGDVLFCLTIARNQANCGNIYKIAQEVRTVRKEGFERSWSQEHFESLLNATYGKLNKLTDIDMPHYRTLDKQLLSIVRPSDNNIAVLNTVVWPNTSNLDQRGHFFPGKSCQYVQLPEKSLRPIWSDIEYTFNFYLDPVNSLIHCTYHLSKNDNESVYPVEVPGSRVNHTCTQGQNAELNILFVLDLFKQGFMVNELCL